MSSVWSQRQREAWSAFLEAVELRHRREAEIRTGLSDRTAAIEEEGQSAQATVEGEFQTALESFELKKQDTIDALRNKYDAALEKARGEYASIKQTAIDSYQTAREELEADFKESRWTAGTVREADAKNSQDQLQQQQIDASNQVAKIELNRKKAVEVLATWTLEIDDQSPPPQPSPMDDAWAALQGHVDASARILEEMRTYGLPKQIIGSRPYLFMSLACLILMIAASCLSLLGMNIIPTVAIAVIAVPFVVFPVGLLIRKSLFNKMERHAEALWLQMEQALSDAKVGKQNAIDQAKRDYADRAKQIKIQYDTTLAELQERINQTQVEHRQLRDSTTIGAQKKYEPYLKKVEAEKETKLAQAETYFKKLHGEIHAKRDKDNTAAETHRQNRLAESAAHHKAEWDTMAEDWSTSWLGFREEMTSIRAAVDRYFPFEQNTYPQVTDVPRGLPFGHMDVNEENVPNVMPQDEKLVRPALDKLYFPAMLPFPEKASLLMQTEEEGRDAGIRVMEALLFRIWTGLPPGRARVTIIDPVGRGENFAAAMHLGDKDANLVNSRIWTELKQIEDVLTDMTGQMETILQRFLRNQYATLAEYNEQADEVAEPFRFVFIANFPVNFSPDAAQRVISLATSGARCGIYTFVLMDTRQPPPHGVNLDDLEKVSTTLVWRDGKYVLQDDLYGKYPLTLAEPPVEEISTKFFTEAAEKAVKALRVEVPFQSITPKFDAWWDQDSSRTIDVPIGKAGARRLQNLLLGKGTSQHVLVAGKTGSGKSTMLHVLIMQLAVRYSPDQVQLYLIDFKKGVEFKTYANAKLPHCLVCAIESEREFGLSVLQRIDKELTWRGEMFRKLGVNDLPTYRKYRDAQPPEEKAKLPPVPRQLLLIDEFQEFFVEDDKVAQEASLLMDRVVRQGRAFGIHLLMGSQTIGGAFSLARTTIDQMAVRIALQCSEADAHLILSRENTEAKLLQRPGEGIYNAQNGMLEGNNFFQCVWIDDELRDHLLKEIHRKVVATGYKQREQMIVFEGNLPADPRKNPHLIPTNTPRGEQNQFKCYLGDAIAIKDPTCAVFRRQSGSNVMMVGQSEDSAFYIQTTACLSIARDHPESQIYFCSGPALEPRQEESVAALAKVTPTKVLTSSKDLNDVLKVLGKEIDARLKGEGSTQPTFLILYGIQRLRDLRKPDDDFGFGSKKGEDEKPHQTFAKLIREGPPVNIFVMLWCDNLTNLGRFLDRQGMREFEMRILFQMNANDSSNLMDSPVAARLGPQRAFFYSEDQGKMEKFRPYGILTPEFLGEFPSIAPAPSPNGDNGNGHTAEGEKPAEKADAGS
jgi:energy-coupling factor transporter ATP-binding protein EcfA2